MTTETQSFNPDITQLKQPYRQLFQEIRHGDDEHQEWLFQKMLSFQEDNLKQLDAAGTFKVFIQDIEDVLTSMSGLTNLEVTQELDDYYIVTVKGREQPIFKSTERELKFFFGGMVSSLTAPRK